MYRIAAAEREGGQSVNERERLRKGERIYIRDIQRNKVSDRESEVHHRF